MKRIAVYGSLRKGEYNYRASQGEPTLRGRVIGFNLYSLGAFPCIIAGDPCDSVEVEVYEFDPESSLFKGIEGMEIGAGYRREEVDFVAHDSDSPIKVEVYTYPTTALAWVGKPIPSGDWAKRGEAA